MVWQQSYKYFSIEFSPIVLDVYDSLKKFGTMCGTMGSRTGMKFRLKIWAKKLRCNNSWKAAAAIKNGTIIHTFYTFTDVIDISYKLNSNLDLISLNFLEAFTD